MWYHVSRVGFPNGEPLFLACEIGLSGKVTFDVERLKKHSSVSEPFISVFFCHFQVESQHFEEYALVVMKKIIIIIVNILIA